MDLRGFVETSGQLISVLLLPSVYILGCNFREQLCTQNFSLWGGGLTRTVHVICLILKNVVIKTMS